MRALLCSVIATAAHEDGEAELSVIGNVRQDSAEATARMASGGRGAALILACSLHAGAAHADDAAIDGTPKSLTAKADGAKPPRRPRTRSS